MYGDHDQEFPSQCREAEYERRIKMAYPIHPELFDRLYNDWSTLDKFQRTRGVLRLMAAVIHSLWERQDSNLLIMPATIPVDDHNVQFELTRYMDDQWVPVIEKDVDGPHSLPLMLDNENPSLGRYSACRRVSRTIYIGSAPTIRASNRGIDDKRVKLGCVQPGESVATFGDALRRLTDRATYLYLDGTRYWYSTQPTVTRLAEDRASQQSDEDVADNIRLRLRESARRRGDFSKVHACTKSSDIPDEWDVRLIILDPTQPHLPKSSDSPAINTSNEILSSRGTSPRTYRNTLLFLAADGSRIKDLEQAVKQYLAWDSIVAERDVLNLDPFQTKQAETKFKNADDTINARIPETYQWLLIPSQSDPKGEMNWQEIRLQGQDDLAVRASKKLKNDGILLMLMGGEPLKHELDRIPLWRGNHVSVKQLIEDFATYLYLPRIKDENVIVGAILNGLNMLTWQTDSFAYAQTWDEQKNRYVGLRGGSGAGLIVDINKGLVVKSDIATNQMEADKVKPPTIVEPGTPGLTIGTGNSGGNGGTIAIPGPGVVKPHAEFHRFYAIIKINPLRMIDDSGKIAGEVVQHLTKQIDAEVEIKIEIQAKLPKGADEKLRRDITENCRTLKFDTFEFEES
jgi:hypothetical protein